MTLYLYILYQTKLMYCAKKVKRQKIISPLLNVSVGRILSFLFLYLITRTQYLIICSRCIINRQKKSVIGWVPSIELKSQKAEINIITFYGNRRKTILGIYIYKHIRSFKPCFYHINVQDTSLGP